MKSFFYASFLFLVINFSCKKEQPEILDPKDPCKCAKEVSADFVIEEFLQNSNLDWIETDTTFHHKDVQFRALEEDAEYKWYIGIQTFDTQAASRYFDDQWSGHHIPITLVVKKEPNSACFPDDDGYDSITKTFYVSHYPIEYGTNQDIEYGSIEGTYRMFSAELNDSIDITVDVRDSVGTHVLDITNVDGSGIVCDQYGKQVFNLSYREIHFDVSHTTTSICTGLSGIIRNKLNGEAEMLFNSSLIDPQDNSVIEYDYHYLGRKLN